MLCTISPNRIGHNLSIYDAAETIAENGYFKGYFSWDLAWDLSKGVEETKRVYREYDLIPTGFTLPCIPVIYSEPDEFFERDKNIIDNLVRQAAEVGYDHAFTWIVPGSDLYEMQENYDIHVRRLREICRIFASYGLKLAIEFIGSMTWCKEFKYPFIRHMGEGVQLCRDVGEPNIGISLDTYHVYTAGDTAEDYDKYFTDVTQIVETHINDAIPGIAREDHLDDKRMLPVESGVVDTAAFFNCLNRLGYTGSIMPEPYSQRIVDMPFAEALKEVELSMRRAFERYC